MHPIQGINRLAADQQTDTVRILFLALLLAVARPGAALPPDLSLLQIHHTAWTSKDGAPADIWALAQSADGFLLLGTGSGLYRFDGVTFERVVPLNQPDLAFRDITALLGTPSGEVWIGYYAGGVSELKNGILTTYGSPQGLPTGWITSFARENDGTIWVAAGGGLGRYSAGHWQAVASDWNFRGHGAHWVMFDPHGTLWVAGGETVQFLRHGAHRFEDTGISSGYESMLAVAPDGAVWLGGRQLAPRPVTPAKSPAHHEPFWTTLDPVKRILFDQDGGLWATDALRGGFYRVTPRNTAGPEVFSEAEGLTSNVAVPLLEDREGNIWVGTNLGLNRFRATRFIPARCVPQSLLGYSLAAGAKGSMLIASGAQLFEADGSQCKLLARLQAPVRSVYLEPDGPLWLGTAQGLVEWIEGGLKSQPLPAPPQTIQYEYVHAATADRSHGLLVSVVNRGLMRFDHGQWRAADTAAPTALWTDSNERQWLGYSDGSVVMRARDAVLRFGPDQGLRVGPITVIRGSAGQLLVAGESGLARFDEPRFVSLSASRSDAFSGITGIIVRPNGDTWLNGNRGVVRMSAAALHEAFGHPQAKLVYELFDTQDGLPGYAWQGEDSTALAGSDGRLWFVTNHGVAWTDPDQPLQNRIRPQVIIRSFLADQRAYPSQGPIELPKGVRSVRIDYTALSLGEPERMRFRYKLEGADDIWRDAGAERSVRYATLRPGRYRFQVIASNGDGVWNGAGATVAFVLPPAFYQTAWFYALIVGTCLGAVWLLLLARLRQITHRERKRLEQRLEDRLNERTRIARELHDSLLQGFQGLIFRLQAVRELLPERPGAAAESLDTALQAGDQAICQGRDAVQNLRSATFEDGDLATAVGALGAELGSSVEPQPTPEYRVMVEGTPYELNPHVRDDIYSVVREAVRNAYQHARATRIETDITFEDTDLRIRVRDDGIGVDPEILALGRRPDHWGLPGMRERCETIGASLKVWSQTNAGTEVELRIPAEIAYVRPLKNTLRLSFRRWRPG